MDKSAIIILLAGIFNFVMGIAWTKRSISNFICKVTFLILGIYLVVISLHMAGIILVLNT